MHPDLTEKIIARRLHTLADQSSDAPYEWAEFKRRRSVRSAVPRLRGPRRAAAIGASAAAAVLVLAITINLSHSTRPHTAASALAPAPANTASQASDRGEQVAGQGESSGTQTRTRAIEGWLADLPQDSTVVRVGAHAAVTSLQDQIAALDDLMSAERVAGAKQSRLDALERQRAQLVSSLAQLRYAEMLASASP
jgi:hypothetical protein